MRLSIQSARTEAQVAVGALLLCLPTLIRPLQFPLSCLAPIWLLIAELLLLKEPSVGAHLRLATMMLSALCSGTVYAACLMSFVKAVTEYNSGVELGIICLVTTIGSIPIAIGRGSPIDPSWMWSLFCSTLFGVSIISTSKAATVQQVWSNTTQWLLLTVAMATVVMVLSSVIILPISAGAELVRLVSELLQDTAVALDRCLRVVCIPPELDDKSISFHGVVSGGSGIDRHTRAHRAHTGHHHHHPQPVRNCYSVPQNLSQLDKDSESHSAGLFATSAPLRARTYATTHMDSSALSVDESEQDQNTSSLYHRTSQQGSQPAPLQRQFLSPQSRFNRPGPVAEATKTYSRFYQPRPVAEGTEDNEHGVDREIPGSSLVRTGTGTTSFLPFPPSQQTHELGMEQHALHPTLDIEMLTRLGFERQAENGSVPVGHPNGGPLHAFNDTAAHNRMHGEQETENTLALDHPLGTPLSHTAMQHTSVFEGSAQQSDDEGLETAKPDGTEHLDAPPQQNNPRQPMLVTSTATGHIDTDQKPGNSEGSESTELDATIDQPNLGFDAVVTDLEGAKKPISMLQQALSVPGLPELVQRTASGPTPQRRKPVQPQIELLHDELNEEEYMEVMYHTTEPPELKPIHPLPLRPPRPGAHLLPPGRALQLRQKLEQAQQFMMPATVEPPLLYVWEGLLADCFGWVHRWWTGCKQVKHTPRVAACKRFDLGKWRNILNGVARLLDSLSALEAVARDMAGDGAAQFHAWDAAHQDAVQGTHTLNLQHGTVWSLWLYAKGSRRVDENPWGHHPHSLHTVVRNALSDACGQAQRLGTALSKWPRTADLPGVNKDDDDGAEEHCRGWHANGLPIAAMKPQSPPNKPQHPHVLKPAALPLTDKHGVQLLNGLETVKSGQDLPFRPVAHTAQHSMAWHRKVLRKAMLLRNLDYWVDTVHSAKTVIADETDSRPLKLLRTEQMRAQYFIAMTTHQVACELEKVTRMLQDACCPSKHEAGEKAGSKQKQQGQQKTSSQQSGQHHGTDSKQQGGKSKETSKPGVFKAFAMMKHEMMWLGLLLDIFLAKPYFKQLYDAGVGLIKAIRGGWSEFKKMLVNRHVQAGFKFYLVMIGMMNAIILITHLAPNVLKFPPYFGYLTAVTVMRPQVESSIAQASFRILGTAGGSFIAFGLMSDATAANNPYLVAVVIVSIASIMAVITKTQYKLVAYVTTTSVWATTLCQYVGCCGHTGSLRYALERMITVSIGAVVPVIVNHTILPWYLSQWALFQTTQSYCSGARLLNQMYEQMFLQLGQPNPKPFDPETAQLHKSKTAPAAGDPGVGDKEQAHDKQPVASNVANGVHCKPEGDQGGGQCTDVPVKGTDLSNRIHGNRHSTANAPVGPVPSQTQSASQQQQQAGSGPQVVVVPNHTTSPPSPEQPAANKTTLSKDSPPSQLSGQTTAAAGQQLEQHPPPKPPVSPANVQSPLTLVVATLARDATLWHRGLYATPLAVHAMMAACTLLSDRLASMEVALLAAQSLTWEFSNWIKRHLMTPLHQQNFRVMGGIMKLAELTSQLVVTRPGCQKRQELANKLQQEVQHVLEMRIATHRDHLLLRQALHVKVIKLLMAHERLNAALNEPTAERKLSGELRAAAQILGAGTSRQTANKITAARRKHLQQKTPRRFSQDGSARNDHVHFAEPDRASSVTVAALQQLLAIVGDTGTGNPANDAKNEATMEAAGMSPQPKENSSLLAPSVNFGVEKLLTTLAVAAGLTKEQHNMVRGLSELVDAGQFSPSDSVVWLACLYALVHAMDAAIHVARVALVGLGYPDIQPQEHNEAGGQQTGLTSHEMQLQQQSQHVVDIPPEA